MSFSERRAWLMAYDISDPRRLVRVHQFLQRRAAAVQYSVFAGLLNAREIAGIVSALRALIDPKHDDVRLYPLPERCETTAFGRCALPEGVLLADRRLLRLMKETARTLPPAPAQRRELEQGFAANTD